MALTHGKSRTPEYQAYMDAKSRCTNKNHRLYGHYGARGIEFNFSSFEEFLDHIGERPSSLLSLDRIDNDGSYEIGNVKWSTKKEQIKNRRSFVKPNLTNANKAKVYLVTDSEGEQIIVSNLTAFCRDNDLNTGNLHATIAGVRCKTHKGFRAEVF